MSSKQPRCVAFDCDGVLADSLSSWKTLHEHFGTDSSDLLSRFMAGEFSDAEFMAQDIVLWKAKQTKIHKDDIFRAYSGCKLMTGARELIADLMAANIHVAIISAGVDIYVSSIATMLKTDDWIANGFNFDEDGWLLDQGVVRVPSKGKDEAVNNLLRILDCAPEDLVCVGDSSMDLSMWVEGSTFIGFNPTRQTAIDAFKEAKVPVVNSKDLNDLRPYLGL
ncbi:MAG: HAD family hydrolase [Candidatus Poseidoniales archaeon]